MEKTTGTIIRTALNKLSPQPTVPSSEDVYNGIELDEDEIEVALYEARKKKYFHLKQEQYWNSVNVEDPETILTAEQWFDLFKASYDVSNAPFEKIVKTLCLYFA